MPEIEQREILIEQIKTMVDDVDDLTRGIFNNSNNWLSVLQDRKQEDLIHYIFESAYTKYRIISDKIKLAYDHPQISKTWTIGILRQNISDLDPGLAVTFDYLPGKYVNSFQFHSYRGWYHHLAIGTVDEVTYVKRFQEELEFALNWYFEGYRGGLYYMYPETPVWVAEEGESKCRAIVGLEVKNDLVIINTEEFVYDYTLD